MPLPTRPVGTVERVYTPLYLLDVGGQPGNDLAYYLHPNGLAVVCLAESHALLRDGDAALAVRFSDDDAAAAPARVSGKRKRGGPDMLPPDAPLAHVSAAGGASFAVRCGVRAALLEVNERLLQTPAVLRTEPGGAGFVAILKPHEGALAGLRGRALSRDAYLAARAAAPAAMEEAAADAAAPL